MSFSATQEQQLMQAKSATIVSAMNNLRTHWATGKWLGATNRYRCSCISMLEADVAAHQPPAFTDISEYIAASAILHCFDGWALLGRALHSELCGDSDSARHMGYYAELRASMSILAAEGVGVFDFKHVAVDQSRALFFSNHEAATHKFAWNALQYWATQPKAVDAVFRTISPGGVPLRDWTDNFAPGVTHVATSWLQEWGLDLQRIAQDREARNLSSYRPSHLTFENRPCVKSIVTTATQLWDLCEPSQVTSFSSLDRHLLRTCLHRLFRMGHPKGRSHRQANVQFKGQLRRVFHQIAPRELSEAKWFEFLADSSKNLTHPLLVDASGTSPVTEPKHSREVLARAFLLLRLATGMTASHLANVNCDIRNELKFWWSSQSVQRGLWDDGSEPGAFSDLWSDIDIAQHDVTAWLTTESTPTFNKLWNNLSAQASVLTTTERVALWGLGL